MFDRALRDRQLARFDSPEGIALRERIGRAMEHYTYLQGFYRDRKPERIDPVAIVQAKADWDAACLALAELMESPAAVAV